jgi:hypothetical protein
MGMKIALILTALGLWTSSMVEGAQAQKQPAPPVERRDPHHVYFGPEFLCYQLNTHVKSIHVHGARFFSGFRVGYEYSKPKAFYAGVDLLGTSSRTDFKASHPGHSLSWHRADRGFGNMEARFGYTFAPSSWRIAPFLGLGLYDIYPIDHHNQKGFQESLPYFTGGFRSKYALNSTFDIGCNVKILRTVGAEQRFKFDGGKHTEHAKEHTNMWGAEIGVPLVWHVSSTKRWDVQLEPYFLKLNFSNTQNIYGTRLLFGYRF